MSRVLIIGAGGVGGVVAHKCAQVPEVFSEITLASRTLSKCEAIRDQLSRPIDVAQVDADDPKQVVAASKEARSWLREFGLTPSSRASVRMVAGKQAEQTVDDFLGDLN